MGRSDTPSWFWPVFVGGSALAMLAVLGSAIAGVWLIAARASEASSSSCPTPQVAYVPPRTYAPSAPTPNVAPSATYRGSISIELVVREARGSRAARGDRCTLTLAYEGSQEGEGACTGELACRDRMLWSTDDRSFACTVRPDDPAVVAIDRGADASLAATMRDGVTTATLTGRDRRGRFVVVAESE